MSSCCSCCGGIREGTPVTIVNRPGLPALQYRAGTHATFLETMKPRLSSLSHPALKGLRTRRGDDPAIAMLDAWAMVGDVLTFYQERIANEGFLRTAIERRSILELARLVGYELRPGVAATTYLAYTLDEDRSVTPPKPSIVTIPTGSRAQSIPEPGQLPQSFETSEPLVARSSWNALKPRPTRPQTPASIVTKGLFLKGVATGLKLNDALLIDFGGTRPVPFRVVDVIPDPPNDRTRVIVRLWKTYSELREEALAAMNTFQGMMGAFENNDTFDDLITALVGRLDDFVQKSSGASDAVIGTQIRDTARALDTLRNDVNQFRFVLQAPYDDIKGAFIVASQALQLTSGRLFEGAVNDPAVTTATTADVLPALLLKQNLPPAHSTKLTRDLTTTFGVEGDAVPRMLRALEPALENTIYPALKNLNVTPPTPIQVYKLTPAAVFGHNAQPKPLRFSDGVITEQGEWPIIEGRGDVANVVVILHEQESVINLDQPYENLTPSTWLVIQTAATHLTDARLQVARAASVTTGIGRSQYGISGKTTRIALGPSGDSSTMLSGKASAVWIHLIGRTHDDSEFEAIRRTTLHFQTEKLELTEAPIPDPIGKCNAGNAALIELDDVYDGLEAGRWVIVAGERVIAGTSGVRGAELVMLAGVEQRRGQREKTRTYLTLADDGLAYCYKRDTVTIYGNVVKATQGETRPKEVLGGGDATKALQQFTLKQPPLTFVPAANPRGIASTLVVRVNEVKWHERESLAEAGPTEHSYMTLTDDEAKTTVIFGSGEHGARLPTGLESVVATYRNGIGRSGNVKADQITLLSSRPPGVKEVTNPLRASGGADRESRDQARANAPLGVMALDRLVSTQDYADFARTFAGIGKAVAARLTTGQQLVVHVTMAGIEDIPIDITSDLHRNVVKALREFGDPLLPIQVQLRELLALILSARVRVLPDYDWEFVAPKIRTKLVEVFGFERRELGQPVFLSEIITVIQHVPGVAWVDIDVLHAIAERELSDPTALATKLADLAAAGSPPTYVSAAPPQTAAQADPARLGAIDGIFPAQLAIFVADADTIILNEVTREP